jgi:formylglycine-generating enzyme required for sulfatase activity
MSGKSPGEIRDDNGLEMGLVWCPPGTLRMEQIEFLKEAIGATDEKTDEQGETNDDEFDSRNGRSLQTRPTEKITPVKAYLTKGYWLGKYEVTQSEWKRVMQTEPWKAEGARLTKEGADFPATYVNWNDATEFCRKITEQERRSGRLSKDWEYTLPTQAQWERACRARTETRFSFGNDESKLGDYAWFDQNTFHVGQAYAHRVGQKKANPWGLFDMHGNVDEWCRDSYTNKLPGGRDPEEKTVRSRRVARGGSWNFVAFGCQSAARGGCPPDERAANVGFRVALSFVR